MRLARLGAIACALALSPAAPRAVAQQPTDLLVASGFTQPVDLVFPRTNRIYVAEKRGVVRVVDNGVLLPQWLIDLREEVGNWVDHGLLGIALDPAFGKNGYLYLAYVVDRHHLLHYGTGSYSPAQNQYNDATIVRVARYTCNPATDHLTVLPGSRLVLLGETATTGPAVIATTHGQGSLLFGRDGTLLVCVGDGSGGYLDRGSASNSYYRQALADGILTPATNVGALRAQQVDSLNGKILRLDPATGDGVPSNPFFDPLQPRSARSRVYAYGLRNPFRATLRPGTGSTDPSLGRPGELWVGDVGWATREEVNVVTQGGQNFGWPLFEGFTPSPLYASVLVDNLFTPNPVAGGACTPYFRFQDLVLDDTWSLPFFPNPCNASVAIAPATPVAWHRLPLIDWAHAAADARVAVLASGQLTFPQIGSPASGVTGVPFQGDCSVGGAWHSGTTFPVGYGACYYHADYVGGWIRRFRIGAHGELAEVATFASVPGPVRIVEGPDHDLYYIAYAPNHTVRRLHFGVDPPPVPQFATSATSGPAPLAIDVDARGSFDPDGQPLLFTWSVDSVDQSTIAQSRVVVTGGAQPELHVVGLEVEDSMGQIATVQVPVSLNNTPPRIESMSVQSGGLYSTAVPTVLSLDAIVSDAEHAAGTLTWAWQTTVHRGSVVHPGAEDPLPVTTTTLAPTPDDGDFYAYSITLTVTDPAGLSATKRAWLFPDRPMAPTSVVLTQPLGGDRIAAGTSTTLAAIASGPVQRVEFRVDGELVGIATNPPYTFAWTAEGDGPAIVSAFAIATDGTGSSSRGSEIVVQAPIRSFSRLADTAADGREDLMTSPGPLLGESGLLLGDDAGPTVLGLRFTSLPTPPGARLVAAHVDFTSSAADAGTAWLLIGCEASLAPAPFLALPGDLTFRSPWSLLWWTPPPWADAESNAAQRTPDLAAMLQPLVAEPAWSGDLALLVYGFVGARHAHAVDGLPAQAPLLCLEWLPPDPIPVTVLPSLDSDDANEVIATGGVDLSASDLVLGGDVGALRLTGLRFQLPIPAGAVVDSARLRFAAAADDSGPAALTVRVQDADDAATFSINSADLSSRQFAAETIAWAPAEWQAGHAGIAQRSPDLRALFQAIVDRPGWTAGNGCVVVIDGTGVRTAHARDTGSRLAPRLEVVFH